MSWQSILFGAALAVYVTAALVYVRLAVFRATRLCRAVFVIRMMAIIAFMVIAYDAKPSAGAIIGAVYVASAAWAWRRQSMEELRAGAEPRGAARFFAARRAA